MNLSLQKATKPKRKPISIRKVNSQKGKIFLEFFLQFLHLRKSFLIEYNEKAKIKFWQQNADCRKSSLTRKSSIQELKK